MVLWDILIKGYFTEFAILVWVYSQMHVIIDICAGKIGATHDNIKSGMIYHGWFLFWGRFSISAKIWGTYLYVYNT